VSRHPACTFRLLSLSPSSDVLRPMKCTSTQALMLLLVSIDQADARSRYMSEVPNGHTNGESTGHANNDRFANDFKRTFRWTKSLCEADTDGDGQSNGLELGDPCCVWTKSSDLSTLIGFANTDISLPGSPRSKTSRSMPVCSNTQGLSSPSSPSPPSGSVQTAQSPQTLTEGPPQGFIAVYIHVRTAHIAHALMLVVAWGLLIPSGAFVSATWRRRLSGGLWLKVHRSIQMIGVLLTLGGLVSGLLMVPSGYHLSDPHHVVGLIVIVFTFLHPVLSMARGKPAAATGGKRTGRRMLWEIMHKGGGYILIAAAGYQCYTGYLLMRDSLWVLIMYGVMIIISLGVLLVGLVLHKALPKSISPSASLSSEKSWTVPTPHQKNQAKYDKHNNDVERSSIPVVLATSMA